MSEATTTLGTPLSPRWDAAWAAEVEHIESQLNRRICGAHSPNWTPCKLGPNHDNGRCRFHGGHPRIGAPKGNLNAVTHGLYMRRLQQCGAQCPVWQLCPLAGADVLALDPKERPHCAYETEEYVATLKTLTSSLAKEKVSNEKVLPDGMDAAFAANMESASFGSTFSSPEEKVDANPDARFEHSEPSRHCEEGRRPDAAIPGVSSHENPDRSFRRKPESPGAATATDKPTSSATTEDRLSTPSCSSRESCQKEPTPLIAQNIALYQTMLSRATAAVRVLGLTDEYLSEGENHRAHSTRVGAILNAQLRIARELRQWIRLAANDAVQDLFDIRRNDPDPDDDGPKGLPDIMMDVLAQTEGILEQALRPGSPPGDDRPGAALA